MGVDLASLAAPTGPCGAIISRKQAVATTIAEGKCTFSTLGLIENFSAHMFIYRQSGFGSIGADPHHERSKLQILLRLEK